MVVLGEPVINPELVSHAGINIGHGHVKLCTTAGVQQYAAVAYSPTRNADPISSPVRANTQTVHRGSKRFEVGAEAALLADPSFDRRVFNKWGDSEIYLVLKQSVLDRLALTGRGPWRVVLGLPVDHFLDMNYRQTLVRGWIGTHPTATGEVWIDQAVAIQEPMGAFWDWAYTGENQSIAQSREVVIVDIGYFTTDLNVVNRGVLNGELGGSIQTAMREVYRAIRHDMLAQTGTTFSDLQLEMAVLGNWPLYQGNHSIDMNPYVHLAMSGVANRLVSWIQNLVEVSNKVMLVAGGGANLLMPHLRSAFPKAQLVMAHEPQLANARGYFRVAKALRGAQQAA